MLEHDDLMTEDLLVLAKLDASGSRKIARKLNDDPATSVPSRPRATCPASSPRNAGSIRPCSLAGGAVQRLSELEGTKKRSRRAV